MPAAFDFSFESRRPVCVGATDARVVTEQALGQQLVALRERLPADERFLVVGCRDRYPLLLACLAAWSSSRVIVLPASDKPRALEEAARGVGSRLLLTDASDEPEFSGLVLRLEEIVPGPAATEDLAFSLAGETQLVTLFTSGTTGTPQRVDKCARQLLGEAVTLAALFALDERSVVASTVPAHHLYGLLFSVLVPYFAGARFVRETPFQPASVLDTVRRLAVTDLVAVPAHLRALGTALDPDIADAAALAPAASVRDVTLRRVFSSGSVLEPGLARDCARHIRGRIIDVLGSTESGGIAIREPALEEVYRPLPGVQVDSDDGRLRLTSPFLDDPEVAVTLGDRIALVGDGFRFEGRSDGVLKIAGNRVSVQELERVALDLPNVEDVAVVVADSPPPREKEPWMVLVSQDRTWTLDKLREALARHFDEVVLPRRLRVVERLPRNALGKLSRELVLALFEDRLSLEPSSADEATATFDVPRNWAFFRGHFPGNPILPGVVQLTEIVLPQARATWPDVGAIRIVRRLKFKRPILPGDALSVHLTRNRARAELSFELRIGVHVASTGVLVFAPPVVQRVESSN
jgi:acyl-CoA synthetase (AMP-forming)/AMP-acid ligase II